MQTSFFNLRNIILTLSLFSVAEVSALPPEVQILDGMRGVTSPNASQDAILKKMKITSSLRNLPSVEICTSALMQVASFSAKPRYFSNTAEELMYAIHSSSPRVLSLAHRVFVDGKTLTRNEISALLSKVDIKFNANRRVVDFLDRNETSIDKLTTRLLQEIFPTEENGLIGDSKFQIDIEDANFEEQGGKISIRLQFTYPNREVQRINVVDYSIGSQKFETALLKLLTAAVEHRKVLSSEENFNQEVNMMRYTLLKLRRVAKSEVGPRIDDLLNRLPDFDKKFFERVETSRGRAFAEYLDVKREMIAMVQDVAQKQALEATSEHVARVRGAAGQSSARAQSRGDKVPVRVRSLKVRETQSPRRNVSYASRVGRSYYYTEDTGSTTISTMAWFMDPQYMLTHPWFWGVRDDSLMSTWLMFEMLSDHHRYGEDRSLFTSQPAYESSQFSAPLEPRFFKGNDVPFVDAWNNLRRGDELTIDTTEGMTLWSDSRGREVNIDTPSTTEVVSGSEARAFLSGAAAGALAKETTPEAGTMGSFRSGSDGWSNAGTREKSEERVEAPSPWRNDGRAHRGSKY